jgi:hypothetical protein
MGSFVGVITKWTCKSNFDFEKDWYIYIYKVGIKKYIYTWPCVVVYYQQCLNDEKKELIMLMFVPFESKYCMPLHATWIEFKFFKFNSNSWNGIWIPLNFHSIQLDPNSSSIEEKWYVNWCIWFLKSTCNYGVKKI